MSKYDILGDPLRGLYGKSVGDALLRILEALPEPTDALFVINYIKQLKEKLEKLELSEVMDRYNNLDNGNIYM